MKALGVGEGEDIKEFAVMDQVANSLKLSTKHLF